jgi:hypothetical protein
VSTWFAKSADWVFMTRRLSSSNSRTAVMCSEHVHRAAAAAAAEPATPPSCFSKSRSARARSHPRQALCSGRKRIARNDRQGAARTEVGRAGRKGQISSRPGRRRADSQSNAAGCTGSGHARAHLRRQPKQRCRLQWKRRPVASAASPTSSAARHGAVQGPVSLGQILPRDIRGIGYCNTAIQGCISALAERRGGA